MKVLLKKTFKKENITWDEILETKSKNVTRSFDNFIDTFNELLFFHAPIQKMSNKEKKLQSKPWKPKGILTLINAKNRIYRKYC